MILLWLFRRLRARRRRLAETAGPRQVEHGERGPLQLVLHQARFDLLAFFRNRQSRFFTLILPIIFLVIFVSVFGNHTVGPQHVKASTYYVPGLSALAVISGSFVNLVISITAQRRPACSSGAAPHRSRPGC